MLTQPPMAFRTVRLDYDLASSFIVQQNLSRVRCNLLAIHYRLSNGSGAVTKSTIDIISKLTHLKAKILSDTIHPR